MDDNQVEYISYEERISRIATGDRRDLDKWQRMAARTEENTNVFLVKYEDGWHEEPELVKDPNGIWWSNYGPHSDTHLSFGGHETQVIQIAKGLLPDYGGVFVDVGAHVGLYTYNLMDRATSIYAVEANPQTFEILESNFQINRQNCYANVSLINAAAWDEDNVPLLMVDEQGMATGGSTHVHGADEETATTRGFRLDTLLPHHLKPDLIKIDVEGAEANVLRGLQEIVTNTRPKFLIEMHDVVYDRPEVRTEVLEFLTSNNYSWNEDIKFGAGYYIIARPQEQVEEFEIEIVRSGE